MLKQLYIKNYTLIDELDIPFHPGFSVITGETGAGKSIILGALSLLLGQRADSKTIKQGADRCVIEARFDLSRYQLEDFFTQNDIDYDATDCILRRELTAAGKSRAFVNDTPVALNVIRQLGQQLVDIHSQHQNLLLQEDDFQLSVVDIIARDQQLLADYQQAYRQHIQLQKAVADLERDLQSARHDEDYLRFLLDELRQADLTPGLQQQLEQESETLTHIEDIKGALFSAEQSLTGEGPANAVGLLRESSRTIDAIRDLFPDVREIADRLESTYIELADIAREVSTLSASLDFDPRRLDFINSQLDALYALEQKHHVGSDEELISIRDDIQQKINNIEHSDEALDELREKARQSLADATAKAAQLTAARTAAARQVEQEMSSRLAPLGIPNVRFSVAVEPLRQLSPQGADRVSFLFSANTSAPMLPVAQIASGGEIARVMLSLKAMVSGAVLLPTIIFDEIDTGVSGRVAEMMARIMQQMGQADRQVISITHLPQIAALGTHHYRVYKEETAQGTKSRMQLLTPDERVAEIAQMLSGTSVTAAAVSNARELLKQS
ncbi:MAG: DNA repair protein RecN [Bacteroidales bacterium]|nr:DNA repair protein RecN [Bacteroidales bacterium]